MPIYSFKCLECDEHRDVVRPMKDHAKPEACSCGARMTRDYTMEHAAVRGDYKVPIVSESLAFDAAEVAQHREQFPNIDLQVEGNSARPILRNLSQRRQYVKDRQFVDTNSFV